MMSDAQLKTVEIYAIGNELLAGQVLDTNTHWLIRQITGLGARVNRTAMLRDDYDHIGDEILGALRRAPALIITTGGLGPTEDDLTLRAIARALDLPMIEHAEALEMVRQRYAHLAAVRPNFSAELNEARRKMAIFPQGAVPIFNPNGAAPAMALDVPISHDGKLLDYRRDGAEDVRDRFAVTTLVSLPGVPSEMKEIFTSTLQPVLESTIGAGGYLEHTIVLDKGDESRIADLLKTVQAVHPSVYIKSRGQMLEDGLHLTVVLSRGGNDLAIIRRDIEFTEHETLAGLMELGYTILRVVES